MSTGRESGHQSLFERPSSERTMAFWPDLSSAAPVTGHWVVFWSICSSCWLARSAGFEGGDGPCTGRCPTTWLHLFNRLAKSVVVFSFTHSNSPAARAGRGEAVGRAGRRYIAADPCRDGG